MSFGGTVTRGRRGARSSGTRPGTGRQAPPGSTARPPSIARGDDGEIDWERVAVFGTGVALGAALGAGVALLFAPHSGDETRAAILRRGVRLAHHGRDAWDELRDELQWAARRGKRRFGRRVQRARWAAEDFLDERRRPDRWRRKGRSAARPEKVGEVPEVDEGNLREIVDTIC